MENFWAQFAIIAGIHLLAVISPGPDFAIVVRNSFKYSRKTGILTALGVALGIMVHVAYCLVGLAVVISKSILLFNAIKLLGAAYLIYIGIMAIRSKKGKDLELNEQHVSEDIGARKALLNGFITNVLNPKATLFFLGLFTQVISPETPLNHQLIYGLEMTVATFVWFAFLAIMISHSWVRKGINNYKHWVDRFMGGVLILLGIKVASSSIN